MALIQSLLTPLKQHVNAMEFDGDDALLERNLKRALRQLLGVCNITLSDLMAMGGELEDSELEGEIPADFAGAVLELAAAMYRYGEAYSEINYRFTPSFEMVMSRYRKHYNPYKEKEDEGT